VAPGGGRVIRVVVADDQHLVRAGLRALLPSDGDIEVVGEAADGLEAHTVARTVRPDVVVMDVRMPGCDGIEGTRLITSDPELTSVRVLVLTTFDLDDHVFAALRAGACGFMLKDAEPDQLLGAVRTVAAGEDLLAPAATRHLIREFLRATPSVVVSDHPELARLTDREREIMRLVALGLGNDDIARRLVISPATVRTHVSRTMGKLGVRDRVQLVVYAYQWGVITPG
jgi:DNA-binding NarL/FixJ family response regulator